MSRQVEELAAGLFDNFSKAAVSRPFDGSSDAKGVIEYAVKTYVEDFEKTLMREASSQAATGVLFRDAPAAFQKDVKVWEAGFSRVYKVFDLKAGVKLVNAFSDLFDVWQ